MAQVGSSISNVFSMPSNPALGANHAQNQITSPFIPQRKKVSWYACKTIRLRQVKISEKNSIAFAFSHSDSEVADCILSSGLLIKDATAPNWNLSGKLLWATLNSESPEIIIQQFDSNSAIIENAIQNVENFGDEILVFPWFYSAIYNKNFPSFFFKKDENFETALVHVFTANEDDNGSCCNAASILKSAGVEIRKIGDCCDSVDRIECIAEVAKFTPHEASVIRERCKKWTISKTILPPIITHSYLISQISPERSVAIDSNELKIELEMMSDEIYGFTWQVSGPCEIKSEKIARSSTITIIHNGDVIVNNVPDSWIRRKLQSTIERDWRIWVTHLKSSIFPPPMLGISANKGPIAIAQFSTVEDGFKFNFRCITLKILNPSMLPSVTFKGH